MTRQSLLDRAACSVTERLAATGNKQSESHAS